MDQKELIKQCGDLLFFWPSLLVTLFLHPFVIELNGMKNRMGAFDKKLHEMDKRMIEQGI